MNNQTSKQHDVSDDSIDLGVLLSLFLRKWWLFAICGIVGGTIMLIITMRVITPLYKSSSMLYVLSKTTSITSVTDLTMASELTEDFSIIAMSNPVLDGAIEQVAEENGTELTRKDAEQMISVNNQASRILVITATTDNAELSACLANAVAEQTMEQMAEITKTDPPTMVEKAEVAERRASPNHKKDVMKGILAGLVVAALGLTITYLMNDHIKTEEDVERYLGLSTLALIPENTKKSSRKNKRRKKEKT